MGFKFKRIDLTTGSADFPSGSSYSLRRSRSEVLVTKIAQAIIGADCGWSLDERCATDTSYVDIPSKTSGEPFPGLFFVNSNGCKLFISYFATNNDYGIVDFSGTGDSIYKVNNSTNRYTSGVCVSMIPNGSSNNFGDPTTTSFLPADATPIIGTVNVPATCDDYWNFCYNPQSGYTASWGIFISPYAIAITAGRSQNNLVNLGAPNFAVGRILGDLVHTTDSSAQSRFGVVTFRCTGAAYEGTTDQITMTSFAASSASKSFFGNAFNGSTASISSVATASKTMGIISRADGTWVSGTDGSTYGVTIYPADLVQTSPFILNAPLGNKSRWCPFAICSFSTDLETYGVVPGDGMKGYLDTELFRCAICSYGQQFDNGNFIACTGANMLLGWDPSNTDSIEGT